MIIIIRNQDDFDYYWKDLTIIQRCKLIKQMLIIYINIYWFKNSKRNWKIEL